MPSGRQKDKVSSIVNATIRQVGSDLIAVRRGLQKSNLAIEDLHIIYICGVVSINVARMAGWLLENPIQMDDLGGTPHFRKSPYQFTRDFLVEAALFGISQPCFTVSPNRSANKKRSWRWNIPSFNMRSVYPLVNKQFAIENGHRNSGFSH